MRVKRRAVALLRDRRREMMTPPESRGGTSLSRRETRDTLLRALQMTPPSRGVGGHLLRASQDPESRSQRSLPFAAQATHDATCNAVAVYWECDLCEDADEDTKLTNAPYMEPTCWLHSFHALKPRKTSADDPIALSAGWQKGHVFSSFVIDGVSRCSASERCHSYRVGQRAHLLSSSRRVDRGSLTSLVAKHSKD